MTLRVSDRSADLSQREGFDQVGYYRTGATVNHWLHAMLFSGTGFSREGASRYTLIFAVWLLTPSRLKPVPHSSPHRSHWLHTMLFQWDRLQPGRGLSVHPHFRGMAADAFPAKAGPTFESTPDLTGCTQCFSSGTGFSREGVSRYTLNFAVWLLTPSRLKPVPHSSPHPISLAARNAFSGTGFSREEASRYTLIFAVWLLTPSRLKPVPHSSSHPVSLAAHDAFPVGPASAGKRPLGTPSISRYGC
jgi:hypothetical protein